jgi:hypothetical protein
MGASPRTMGPIGGLYHALPPRIVSNGACIIIGDEMIEILVRCEVFADKSVLSLRRAVGCSRVRLHGPHLCIRSATNYPYLRTFKSNATCRLKLIPHDLRLFYRVVGGLASAIILVLIGLSYRYVRLLYPSRN